MRLDLSTLVLAGLALVFAVIAYVKDPSLPLIGARNGLSMLGFVLPRLIPALLLAGLFPGVVPRGNVSRYLGPRAGPEGLVVGVGARRLPPRRPQGQGPLSPAPADPGAPPPR